MGGIESRMTGFCGDGPVWSRDLADDALLTDPNSLASLTLITHTCMSHF